MTHLTRFFARSLLRGGLIKGVLFLLVLSLLVAFALSDIDMGDHANKLFLDLLLISEAFWLHALVLLWAYELGKNEQLLKLARLPLSTPLNRASYEISCFLALLLAFAPIAGLLLALDLIVASPLVIWQLFLYELSALLGGFLVLTLSRFFSPVSAVLYAAALIMIGNGLDELYLYSQLKSTGAFVGALGETLFVVLPNFSLFDHQGEAVSGYLNSLAGFYAYPIAYAAVLGAALLALSVWRFRRSVI